MRDADLTLDAQEARYADQIVVLRDMLNNMALVHPLMNSSISASPMLANINEDFSTQKPQSKRVASMKQQVDDAHALIEQISAYGETVVTPS
jgi:hypothetical protein